MEVILMVPVTLKQLEHCKRQYSKVRSKRITEDPVWQRDLASLLTAIKHAKQGVTVFVTNNVGETLDGQKDYYLLAGSIELEATLCSNHLSKRVPPVGS